MKGRLVQVGFSLALLLLLVQIVLVAPTLIRDSETKAAIIPTPDLKSSSPGSPGLPATDGDVDQAITGFHMIETQEGKKEWEIWADKAVSMKAKDQAELKVVRSIFFSETGETFTVTGDRGMVEVKSKNMRIEGNVVTRSSNGYTFRTDNMDYNSQTRLLTTVAFVDIEGPKDANGHLLKMKGTGMKASVTASNVEILNDVTAQKSLDRDRLAIIRSKRAILSGNDRTARFLGNVVLDMDSMRVTGPEAVFDYDSKRELVRAVQFLGGARVSDADKWATAQNARIDLDTDKMVLRGSPRVVQNNDELRGEEIVFLDKGKRVQVKGARAKVDEKRLEKQQ